MLDHLSIGVADLARAGAFYDAVLATLGYVRVLTHPRALGWGAPGAKDEAFAILSSGEGARAPGVGCHVAFVATSPSRVDEFHAVALREGGTDEGAAGPRPEYGEGYYAAFVRDLDGYRIEAVFHR
ncbi:MAG: VOC family protein [Polyangiaceae bacterium]|nr:VOC family protein [Polyangiaceae bacterium]MCE7891263.1 VOC family protein [Sorangiineae bacterium PRO1]MCL4754879.1 VOC family protein [Myxococcales bacterium]